MGHKREPIPNTCPIIDKYIRNIKSSIVENPHNYDKDELIELIKQLNRQLDECIDYLEEMRIANKELRWWGEDEANMVDQLTKQIQELESKCLSYE